MSDEETLSDMLRRRERELIQQTAALRGLLVPKEKELEGVRKAMEAIGLQRSYAEELRPFLETGTQTESVNTVTASDLSTASPTLSSPTLGEFTIKQMILAALKDHFHNGATPSELREYMRSAYNREIDRNSISPQLGRLRDEEGMVDQLSDGKWKLSKHGRGVMRYGAPREPDRGGRAAVMKPHQGDDFL